MTHEPSERQHTLMLSASHTERRRAHRLVQTALETGQIQLDACEICGTCGSIVAHHPGYSKPLIVICLCRSHHGRVHAEMRKMERRLQYA